MNSDVLELLAGADPMWSNSALPIEAASPMELRDMVDMRRREAALGDPSRRPGIRPSFAFLTAAAVVLGAVGIAVLLAATRPSEPVVDDPVETSTTIASTTTVATTVTSTTIAALGSDAGTLSSSIGDLAWSHLTGTHEILPAAAQLLHTPRGYVGVEHNRDPETGATTSVRFWSSPDGVEWVSGPLPGSVEPQDAWLVDMGGNPWLVTSEPPSLWRSDAGENWSEVPLPNGAAIGFGPGLGMAGGAVHLLDGSGGSLRVWRLDGTTWTPLTIDMGDVREPAISGLTWSGGVGDTAFDGSSTVAIWSQQGRIDFGALASTLPLGADPSEITASVDPDTSTVQLYEGGGGFRSQDPIATLSVDATRTSITLSDASGRIVHQLDVDPTRTDAAQLVASGDYAYVTRDLTVAIDGDVVTVSEAPWAASSLLAGRTSSTWGTVVPLSEGGFRALVGVGGNVTTFEVWSSADGHSWSGPTSLDALNQADGSVPATSLDGDVIVAQRFRPGDERMELWVSIDGIDWIETGVEAPGYGSFASIESGFLFASGTDVFTSQDLRSWTRVDVNPLSIKVEPLGAGGFGTQVIGSTLVMTLDEDSGPVDMWFLAVDR